MINRLVSEQYAHDQGLSTQQLQRATNRQTIQLNLIGLCALRCQGSVPAAVVVYH
jgi:hypothetical protein